jgi:hypothetical protein
VATTQRAGSGAGTQMRRGAAEHLLRVSRAGFAASFVLVYMGPVWQAGPFAQGPFVTLRYGGHDLVMGPLAALPMLSAGTWLAGRALARRWKPTVRLPAHLFVPMALFTVLVIARLAASGSPEQIAIAAAELAVLWASALYVLYEFEPRRLLWMLAALLLVAGGLGTVQFALQRSAGLPAWLEQPLDPLVRGVSVIEASGRRWLRAYGTFSHPNTLGAYLCLSLLIGAGLYGEVQRVVGLSRWERALLAMAGVCGLFGCVLSFSRSAWLGLLVGGVVALGLARPWAGADGSPRARRRALRVAAGGLAVASVLVALLRDLVFVRLVGWDTPLESTSVGQREIDVGLAWGLIRAKPLFGVGPWRYIPALWETVGAGLGPDYPGFRAVHSTPLLVAAELGLTGGVLQLAWLAAPLVSMVTHVRRLGWRVVTSRQASLVGAIVAVIVIGATQFHFYTPVVTLLPAVYLGMMSGLWAHAWGEPCAAPPTTGVTAQARPSTDERTGTPSGREPGRDA